MLTRLVIILFAFGVTGCSTLDYDPPSKADQKATSCREDPYQDMCQPGALAPSP